MNTKINSILILSFSILISACGNDGGSGSGDGNTPNDPNNELNLPETHFNYEDLNLPEHYLINSFNENMGFQHAAIDMDNTPYDTNPITNSGATLGRVLFYDQKLSANGTISCASCHKAEHGFSDNEILSIGWNGELTRRHSMGIVNSMFYFSGKFFWDERASTLEEQVLMPFQDEVEMGLTLTELENIAKAQSYYPKLFEDAFGTTDITSERISKALSQFIRSMVSTTSRYDIARAKESSPTVRFDDFTDQENDGKSLFFRPRTLSNGDTVNCSGCHITEAFVGSIPNGNIDRTTSTNNGLDLISTDDFGIFETTNNRRDTGKFKTPSLRNISIRAPYMHDGRFLTLREVLNHYSEGIQMHENLSAPLIGSDGNPVKFDFTEEEKDALIAFFDTLTDYEMLQNEKFSNPFN